jgi:RNA polymerase sigma-70 factor, ECF subfamily
VSRGVGTAKVADHNLSRNTPPGSENPTDCRVELTSDAADAALVRQLQAGNHDALTTLFEKYSSMVFGIARRMLRDDGEAEEVVQQVFLDTYRAIDQFDERKGPYKTWLFQYAYHRTLNRKKHLAAKGFYSRQTVEEHDLPAELFQGAGRRVRLYSQEMVHLVEQLLSSISPRQRETIELTYFEGLTAEEIATKTGETATTVRHSLYRGLQKLRSALVISQNSSERSLKSKVEAILLGDAARLL